jgi:hypothetical protein
VFPKRWLWLQCNVFKQAAAAEEEEVPQLARPTHPRPPPPGGPAASLLLSIAELPLPSPQLPLTSFEGLLALLWIPTDHHGGAAGGDGSAATPASSAEIEILVD